MARSCGLLRWLLVNYRKVGVLGLAAFAVLPITAQSAVAEDSPLTEIVVTSQRREQSRLLHSGNIARLDGALLARVQHQHIHELLSRISGVWLSRGSGQEHLTAIRSPVLTGAGSCGAFLFLEDGIPIRPAGFCNVNSLFEVNTEQAQSIEVIRGPGNALFGSNALHGIVNVLMPMPGHRDTPELAIEVGANDYMRTRAELPFDAASSWLAAAVYANDGGFRDDSGYRQGKLHVKRHWKISGGDLTTAFTFTDLNQDTAGFIIGENSYKDPNVNRSNPNPDAFRNATSLRTYAIWSRSTPRFDLDIRPYLRFSEMEFLQHFLPGKPLEENGHVSLGIIATAIFDTPNHRTIAGVDIEWSDMFLKETQDGPTQGSDFLRETRPAGKHYDYTVSSIGIAPYLQSDYRINERLTLGAGLRTDALRYNYSNRMLSGNTRDDGEACGFGGCLYSRPADRSDNFTNFAPKLSLIYKANSSRSFYAVLARGFRAPQATELYRLQSGQQVADLDSERIDSIEFGVRKSRRGLSADVAVFAMSKRGSIFRDAEGYNVGNARSKHRGIEFSLDWQLTAQLSLSIDTSYARHTYAFDVIASRGEEFVSGRDIDTAPRWLGNIDLVYAPNGILNIGLQLVSIGEYYLDAENRFRYPGHTLANLRVSLRLSSQFELAFRLHNIMDRSIADRADYAFGNYRYFPGRGRELFAELRYSPKH